MTTYAASKGYITSFGKALATELKDKIDVLTLAPSYVATRMISNLNPDIFVATAE